MVETGGHRSIADVPPEVIRIVDVKCPASGESAKNHWPNLDLLRPHDEVKFVIQDRGDYEFARDVVQRHELVARTAAVLFSPVHGVLDAKQLAAWILEDRLAGSPAAAGPQVRLGTRGPGRLMAARGPSAQWRTRLVHGRRDDARRRAWSCSR